MNNPVAMLRSVFADAMQWRESQARCAALTDPLRGLALAAYSHDECLLAAAHCPVIPVGFTGIVAMVLWHRTNRGVMTLKQALDRLVEEPPR